MESIDFNGAFGFIKSQQCSIFLVIMRNKKKLSYNIYMLLLIGASIFDCPEDPKNCKSGHVTPLCFFFAKAKGEADIKIVTFSVLCYLVRVE
jgi:hypothetical protein